MGCDIHAVFQAKKNDEWVDVSSEYDEDRHYALFAWLGGVRGVDIDEIVADHRGIPADFALVDYQDHPVSSKEIHPPGVRNERDYEYQRVIDGVVWMGDHGYSWALGSEILASTPPEKTEYFTDEIKRLMELHGEIRMVFGFDN